ncbi:MAG: DUF3380 domain-containing protein [Rhodoferax sp.]|nr:DUF3380 domain-containing protein [Rhodoferax sp.]
MSGRIHEVKKGDTLGKIAKDYTVPVKQLIEINQLPNPNQLEVHQRIVIDREAVLGFHVLALDVDRNPIEELMYYFEFSGKVIKGKTGPDGKSRKIATDSPEDRVRILVRRLDNSFKEIGTVISGYGDKLVTLVSPSIKVEAKTQPHPNAPKGKLPSPKAPVKPAFDPTAKQPPTTDKKKLGPVAKPSSTEDGKPLVTVEGDIPELDLFLGTYVGGELSQKDIEAAAAALKCEPGLIYAIARQESAHSSFFKIGKRTVPKILYERHWFRKLTKPNKKSPSPYEEKYPDICGPAYHKTKRDKKTKVLLDSTTGLPAKTDNIYGAGDLPQYKRLVKAYQLDKDAALQACSFGKFQIMGFNYKAAGYKTVHEFTRAMSLSDAEHMKAFLKFAKSNTLLLEGLQSKDYEKIAEGHNGGSWKAINPKYASNLEGFYNEYEKKNK